MAGRCRTHAAEEPHSRSDRRSTGLLRALARGLLDGDGNIYTLLHAPTRKKYPNYTYERLWTHFTSASEEHIEWLRAQILIVMGLRGYIERRRETNERHAFFRLKYGNRASVTLLSALYAAPGEPRLERK